MPGPDFSIRLGLVGTATVLTGIQSVLTMAGSLVGKIRELAEAADAYGDVVNGHTVSVQQAQIATNGLIDSITLHQQAARMEAAGVQVTAEQLRSLAVAATNYANTTGADINESFVGLTESVTRCTQRGLRPYGIELERGASRGRQQQSILAQLTASFGDQTSEVEGTADAFTALENTASQAFNEMLLAAERNAGPLQVIIRGITSVVTDLANALETQRRAQEHMARMGTTSRQLEIQNQLESAGYDVYGRRRSGAGAALQRGVQTYSLFGTMSPDDWARQQAEQLRLLGERDMAELAAGAPAVSAAPAPLYSLGEGGTGGGGGGRSRDPRAALAGSEIGQRGWDRFIQDVVDAQQELSERVAELYHGYGEDLTEFWEDLGNRQKEGEENLAQKRVDAIEAANELARESWEAYQEQVTAQIEEEDEAREAQLARVQNYAQTMAGVYNTLVGAVGGLASSLATNAEQQKKIQGGVYMAEQVGALLLATTMMAVSIADQRYDQAVAYGAAIVAAGIGIAKTAVEFGVSSKSGVGGGGSAAHASDTSRGHASQGYQPTMIVHINGPVTSQSVNEDLIALQRDSARAY